MVDLRGVAVLLSTDVPVPALSGATVVDLREVPVVVAVDFLS